MPPAEYAQYHGITEEQEHEKINMLKLLVKAPKAFLDGRAGTVLLLVRLYVHVDIHQRKHRRKCI